MNHNHIGAFNIASWTQILLPIKHNIMIIMLFQEVKLFKVKSNHPKNTFQWSRFPESIVHVHTDKMKTQRGLEFL